MLTEAALLLLTAKFVARAIPFRILANRLGKVSAGYAEMDAQNQVSELREIGWALRAVGRRVTTLKQCLLQGIAARWMLNRRQIANALYLGVRKDENGNLLAHAWLRAGNRTVVGDETRPGFHIIAAFGEEAARRECDVRRAKKGSSRSG